ADFFQMFDTPFRYGRGWDGGADEGRARVAVISSALNDKLFGGVDSVGRSIRLDQAAFTVVGVLGQWRPVPKFYDMYSDTYSEVEQVFVPFSTSRDLDMSRSGSMDCFAPRDEGL